MMLQTEYDAQNEVCLILDRNTARELHRQLGTFLVVYNDDLAQLEDQLDELAEELAQTQAYARELEYILKSIGPMPALDVTEAPVPDCSCGGGCGPRYSGQSYGENETF